MLSQFFCYSKDLECLAYSKINSKIYKMFEISDYNQILKCSKDFRNSKFSKWADSSDLCVIIYRRSPYSRKLFNSHTAQYVNLLKQQRRSERVLSTTLSTPVHYTITTQSSLTTQSEKVILGTVYPRFLPSSPKIFHLFYARCTQYVDEEMGGDYYLHDMGTSRT